MNKVITINLHGNAYQLEEAGYDALRAYLDHAARELEGNPDKDEIIADIEQAIADKCRAVLSAYRTVVSAQDIATIIAEMGPVDAGDTPATGEKYSPPPSPGGPAAGTPGPAKRLYRILDGAMIGGVCNGIGAYFAIDPTLVRVLFVFLAFVTLGGAAVAYIILEHVIPAANSATEKAAAFGEPSTAQEFIHRARKGYYEGMKTFGDKHAHREWKRRFRQEMRGWRHAFRHEMRANAFHWQQNWQHYWDQHPHHHFGLSLAMPFLSLLKALITFVWIFAVISLLTTGAIFGVLLPFGLPWWAGLILLVVAFNFLVWPIKAIRRSYYWHGLYGPRGSLILFGLWDTLVWLGFLALLIWLADRYVPSAHQAIVNLPPALHHAADAVRQWWAQK